ncbi:sensor histidine kinase [Salinibacterium sp. SYSU T00001]|uniref:sensor histidine kinase n=1 Tax=Homoserinimonas sedimenticola TaxID=2986805 RepID=UPI0022363683|nr:sensor histidine kinase [Salinibacterium sedimenticola]MCW4386012.1 sensor histidine kinase [Salinibacterium sedimenticola]
MTINRWWHAAIATALAACSALVVWSADAAADVTLGLGAVALFAASWLLLAPRAVEGNLASRWLRVALVATTLLGCIADPNFAFFQCFAHPLAWVLSSSKARGVAWSSAVAIAVGAGFIIGGPFSGQWIGSSLLTAALSLAFSIAFGLWISHIAELGEERQRLLDELRATQEELVAVSREAGIAAERERLARDIHDTVAQDLTGLVMLAEQARRTTDAAARDALLAQVADGARNALEETRALVAASAPASLDAGLAAAIERVAARFSRDTGIAVTVQADAAASVDRDAEVVLLRCTQEALTNIRRHSGASSAHVELEGATLRIRDDGHGFDPASPTAGVGLAGMRDRARLAGGSLTVKSDESGTVVTVTLPALTPPALTLPTVSPAKEPTA